MGTPTTRRLPVAARSTNHDPHATVDPTPAPAGDTAIDLASGVRNCGSIGRFTIRGFLGAGTFGTVYRAHDPQLDREIALKTAPAAGQSLERMQRFRREACTAAGLRHPHIVPLFEAGEADGLLFLASAYVAGLSLADAIHERHDRGGFAPRDAAVIVQKLADALAYAHGQGVLHRDVKSANVMLDPAGEPHLLDFGLARRFADEEKMTQAGAVLGTPAYLAPEVCRGDTARWTPAVDQYALGIVLYELLAGQTPFGGPTEVVLALQQMQEPERPSRKNPAVPWDLEAVCLKCIEKDPAKRYKDCATLADDLRRWLDGLPTIARPVSSGERLVRWAQRNRALAGLYATLGLVIAGIVVAAFSLQRQKFKQQLARESTERKARATALVESLETADIAGVPIIVRGLGRVRAEAEPLLRLKHAATAPGSNPRFRLALARLPEDAGQVDELLAYLPTARAAEVLVLREAFRDHADRVKALMPRQSANATLPLQTAGLLAGYLPADDRWQPYAADLAGKLVRINPLELAAWAQVFDPLHRPLTPALFDTYRTTQARLKVGDLTTQELVEAATQFDLAATLLARAADDQPEALVELLQTADPRHYAAILESAKGHRPLVIAAMRETVNQKPDDNWTSEALESLATRQANAAVTLLRLGEPEAVWALLRHTPDPTARSYLIHGLGQRGADPKTLLEHYQQEPDTSAQRALVLSLGFGTWTFARQDRDATTERLLRDFRYHPDAGLHGAIDWLFRRHGPYWAGELDRAVDEKRGQPAGNRDWFVNTEGQTFTVVRGPVEFLMGSPSDEPGREAGDAETQHRKRIGRSFAIAAREVTVAEYLRFNKDFRYRKQYAPEADGPISETTWYAAAAYCRWLSERDGVPDDQMCYPPVSEIKAGMKLPANFLTRTGYRLPTEAEWEYACRAGAVTARPYGRGTELLTQYAWGLKNSNDRLWPGGRLKPNDLGLFDMLGNAWEWCQDEYSAERTESDDLQVLVVSNDKLRLWRGGSFIYRAPFQRSAARHRYRPDDWGSTVGLRPARTYR
jgi:formylglycine-generating enzyme required for sulfatase activity